MQIDSQDGCENNKEARHDVVKDGDFSLYKYEKHVRDTKCTTHLNESVGRRLVTSRKLCIRKEERETTSTENGMAENHSTPYVKVESIEAELLGAEDYPHYQI